MGDMDQSEHIELLSSWMHGYRPRELFDDSGRLVSELAALAPAGERRMSANPHANGGALLRDLQLPELREHALRVAQPGAVVGEATRVQGKFIRDVIRRTRTTSASSVPTNPIRTAGTRCSR
jgi:xylulose-5-phosphate/fructose-6-phosphate phosphoketolase